MGAPRRIPAVYMRGGTSKGLFFHERDLPAPGPLRDLVLLSVMGSPDPYGRQLDGMGGGLSSLSKIIVVRRAEAAGADIEFLHGQVSIDAPVVDYSANCGNLSAAVAPFALAEGLAAAPAGEAAAIRLRNLNTGVLIEARVPLAEGRYPSEGDFAMPGVAGHGARVDLRYLNPGAGDGSVLFPTGARAEGLEAQGRTLQASFVQATLPTAWVLAVALGLDPAIAPDTLDADRGAMAALEQVRRIGAVRMGLAPTEAQAALASPKVAIVGPPRDYVASDGRQVRAQDHDILARAVSMGRAHKALPLTAAMCLAAAALTPGTVPAACLAEGCKGPMVRIGTPAGVLTVGADLAAAEPHPRVVATIVYSTARRLMDGAVYADV